MCSRVPALSTLRGEEGAFSGEPSREEEEKKNIVVVDVDVFALFPSQINSPRHRRGVPLVAARVLAKVDLLLPLLEPARVGLLLLGGAGADGGRRCFFLFSRKKGKARGEQLKKKKSKSMGADDDNDDDAHSLSLPSPTFPLLPAFYSPGAAASSPTAKSSVVSLEGAGGLDAICSSTPLFLFEGVVFFFFFFPSEGDSRGEEDEDEGKE